jgi:hypothetical protein
MPWKYTEDPQLWEDTIQSDTMPLNDMSATYVDYLSDNDYVLLRSVETGNIISISQPKRGNLAYARKQRKKLEPIDKAMQEIKFDYVPPAGFRNGSNIRYTKALFFTLLMDKNVYSMQDAWLSLKGSESLQNKFKAYMRKLLSKYHGQVYCYSSHARKEAQSSGYPHIHMIVLLDHYVRVRRWKSSIPDKHGKYNYTWRIEDKEGIVIPLKEAWAKYSRGSYCDIQGIVNNNIVDHGCKVSALMYLMKYVTKDVDVRSPKSVYTHMMLKFFNMRDIFSKSFLSMLNLAIPPKRHDIIRSELKLVERKIQHLESFQTYWGYLSSPRKVELERLLHRRQELIELKKQQDYKSKEKHWIYEGTVTINTIGAVNRYYKMLADIDSSDNKSVQDFLGSIASLPDARFYRPTGIVKLIKANNINGSGITAAAL